MSVLGPEHRGIDSPQALAAQLRSAVEVGRLSGGAQLPTIRQLMNETGLTYSAVNRAISILQAEGLVVSRKRAGTFVTDAGRDEPKAEASHRLFALIAPELSLGYYPTLQRAFDSASGQRGFQIIATSTDNDVRVQSDALTQVMKVPVSGVAIVPATLGTPATPLIHQLQRRRIPVVVLHRAIEGVAAPLVTIPAEEVGRRAGQELAARGHRRVGYLASQRAGVARRYEQGLREALAEVGASLEDHHVHFGDFVLFDSNNYALYEAALGRWFDRYMTGPNRPTAVFTSFETVGELVYVMAIERGIRVPDDLSIVTISGAIRNGMIARRLACVTMNEQRAGHLTAELLDQMQAGERPIASDEQFAIELGFDPAQSLAPPAATAVRGTTGRRTR